MEIFAGDKVLVELVVKRVIEDTSGISYDVVNEDGFICLNVGIEQIKDVEPYICECGGRQ